MIKHGRNKSIIKPISFLYIGIMLLITYAPILILVTYSFTTARALGQWTDFTFDLYKQMFTDSEILSALFNSLIIALTSAFVATIIGTAAAVGIFYMRKYPKAVSNAIGQITMVNADIVTGVGFLLFFVFLKIPKGYITLIIAHTVICIPYVVMSVIPRLSQLNPRVYDAGLDLGATHMRTFFTVVMPQLVSGMVSGFMLAVTISLDDFVVSKYINGMVTTIPVYLYTKLAKKGVMPVLRALSAILFLAVLAILVVINIAAIRREKKLKSLRFD